MAGRFRYMYDRRLLTQAGTLKAVVGAAVEHDDNFGRCQPLHLLQQQRQGLRLISGRDNDRQRALQLAEQQLLLLWACCGSAGR
ncbi:hypothetical protein D3C76_1627830 [compost metagenome]